MSVKPVAVGLVVCELVVVDDKTRNITAVSCFSRRVVEVPLAWMPPFFVVVALADGQGTMPAQLVIERLDTLESTYERAFQLRMDDSLRDLSVSFRVQAQAIPVFGFYQAQFLVDGEMLAQKRFSILSKEANP